MSPPKFFSSALRIWVSGKSWAFEIQSQKYFSLSSAVLFFPEVTDHTSNSVGRIGHRGERTKKHKKIVVGSG
jgi:hypothetical protein